MRGIFRALESSTHGVILAATTVSSNAATLGGRVTGVGTAATGSGGGGGGGGGGGAAVTGELTAAATGGGPTSE